MKRILLLAGIGMSAALACQAQTSSLSATIVIADPPASCTVGSTDDLDYGVIIRPSSGSGQTVTISETSGNVSTSSGISNPSTHEVGYTRITAVNASSFTISRSFPSDLNGLTYAGTWAGSESAGSGYSSISGTSHTQTGLGGAGGSASRHYRFGGTISGIGSSTTLGTYDDSISLSVTCTQ